MSDKRIIRQFAPESGKKSLGDYGWGFDINGFRVVMYAPPEFDHEAIKAIDKKTSHHAKETIRKIDEEEDHAHYSVKKKAIKRYKEKQRNYKTSSFTRGQEHGPAHIHVIDKKSGRESKFELIEHYNRDEHHVELLAQNGSGKTPLIEAEINAALPILNEHAETFIQMWREFYVDTKLSNYVSRIAEDKFGSKEKIRFDHHGDKYVDLIDRNGSIATMLFDQYLVYLQDNRRR